MRKVIYMFIVFASFFSCSNSDDNNDGGNSIDNIEFDKIHVFNEELICAGCPDAPEFHSYITFLTSNLNVQEWDGNDYLYGQGWFMDLILNCDLNDNDLPEEGMYLYNRLFVAPFTFTGHSLHSYDSDEDNFAGEVNYIESYAEGSFFDISYDGSTMNISYRLKLRDNESNGEAVDLTMDGQYSTEINNIISGGLSSIYFHPN